MNLSQVMAKGITKIRKEKWANPDAYIELYKDTFGYGPWGTLHDEWGRRALGDKEYREIRKILLLTVQGDEDWVEYKPKEGKK